MANKWIIVMKAANYHYGVLPELPELYLANLDENEEGEPVVDIVTRIADAKRFATEREADFVISDVMQALQRINGHHDPRYVAFPAQLAKTSGKKHSACT